MYSDLKPESIIVAPDGYVTLVDFGLAKRVTDRTYSYCGTQNYMAPEIIMGKGYSKSVDYWALGTLIYEMHCGQPPFMSSSPKRLLKKILTQRPKVP